MQRKQINIPILELRQLLSYDPDTGDVRWRERSADMFDDPRQANAWNGRFAGTFAGRRHPVKEYVQICVLGSVYQAHHLAWALHYGEFVPVDMELDHINHNPSDNRIENLRIATSSQNKRNRRAFKGKSSKYKGVSLNKPSGKWSAYIRINGVMKNLGSFKTEEDAYAAYCAVAKELHGDFFHG
jgi:hypothetical protein